MPRHYILVPVGSSGDVNPFLWIAKCLHANGHKVTLLVTPPFEDAAARLGVGFKIVGKPGEYEAALENPDLWHPRRGIRTVMRFTAESTGLYFDAIQTAYEHSSLETVLVGGTLAFGARIAREKFRLPLVSIHLQPSVFMSIHDTPVPFAGLEWFTQLPGWCKRFVFSLPNPIDRVVGPAARTLCIRVGVTPPRRIWPDWFHSPDLVIGLFPQWYAPPQPDWPVNHRLPGFPLYDLADHHDIPADLQAFLEGGDPPVLITPGSAMAHGNTFLRTAQAACEKLGRRSLLVSPFRDQLPRSDSRTTFHVDRIPFSLVLPHTAALVHHGGVGTLSQGLAAGKPQLIMPMAHDQPDNANRLRKLGAGRMLYPKHFTPERVAAELRMLLGDDGIAAACTTLQRKVQSDTPREDLMRALEGLDSG